MSEHGPIGRAKGPGQTPHEFTFVSPDPDQNLKVGEFVTYKASVGGQERTIFSRITSRQPLRLYPDTFAADPAIDPADVATLVGYQQVGHELFELTATVIGYYDNSLGDFINPRLPPRNGRPIHLAPDETLAQVLTKKQTKEVGSAHIGSLLSRDRNRVPVNLDVAAITGTHLAVIASTGAGKSYLSSVLIEEMMMPYNRAAVLIVDPHGEYNTLSEMQNNAVFQDNEYRPEVRIFKTGTVQVRSSSLTFGDLRYLLPNLSDRMEYLLGRAYRDVRRQSQRDKGEPERWTQAELIARLRQLGEGEGEDSGDQYASTANALTWRLESIFEQATIFDDFQHLKLTELFRPGRCSVLQLNEVDEKEQQVMVATLLRQLFRARAQTQKGQIDENNELYLPYPVFVLIEEAHHFAPAAADIVSTNILKQILAEGRKFGVGVGLISQRPGKLDADVLSQCNTQFLLRIVNPVDQARVAESVETIGRELLRELPALTKGQVIVAGETVNTPILCQVRTRYTTHGAETANAPTDWINYFTPEEQARRKRATALPAETQRQGKSRMFKSRG